LPANNTLTFDQNYSISEKAKDAIFSILLLMPVLEPETCGSKDHSTTLSLYHPPYYPLDLAPSLPQVCSGVDANVVCVPLMKLLSTGYAQSLSHSELVLKNCAPMYF